MKFNRKRGRRDGNEAEIIEALRSLGASVEQLEGKGLPDLLVGWRGKNILLEVKDPNATRGRTTALKLTDDQVTWHRQWSGQVAVVTTVTEALVACGAVQHKGDQENVEQPGARAASRD